MLCIPLDMCTGVPVVHSFRAAPLLSAAVPEGVKHSLGPLSAPSLAVGEPTRGLQPSVPALGTSTGVRSRTAKHPGYVRDCAQDCRYI